MQELSRTEGFVCTHVSDHSGFHYRHQLFHLIRRMLPNSEYVSLIRKEAELSADLIDRYTGHEALWYHRYCVLLYKFVFLLGHPTLLFIMESPSLPRLSRVREHKA